MFDLSVVIVNYNVREFLEQALRSVERASERLSVEVFVVDNNSVDGSVEMVRERFPEVHVIANKANVGFSRANNQAIRRARGRYLLILNPDTIVQEDTFRTLLRFMEAHPEAGAVGCKILNPDGTFAPESRRAFPRPSVAFYRIVGLSRLFPRSRRFGRYNMTFLPQDEVAEVDALSGSCMLVRHAALYYSREAWAQADDASAPPFPGASGGAGLFDEDFFMYGEDLDWCYRIQQAGWKIYYTPETQIIHYKGESTKKGELRYVRLFYGAMLRFSEKHFRNRYSRLFAHLLRLGIVVRAGLSIVGNAARAMAAPGLDAGLVYLVVVGLGILYSLRHGTWPSPLHFAIVAPAYALGMVTGIAAAGGYRRRRLRRLRPVWTGTVLGLLVVAAASFFFREIAFSRFVVLLSAPVAGLLLAGRRLAGRARAARNGPARHALLVGRADEAGRLKSMLDRHPNPPFSLVGYVEPERRRSTRKPDAAVVPRLGTLRHLRDLIRLRQIDDVVFAADGLSYRTMFGLVQQLRDLPVQFRILAEGREHVIGKSAVDDLSLGTLIAAEEALGAPRSTASRRAFELPLALIGCLLHPVVWALARLTRNGSFFDRLAERTRQMPAVLAGRLRLVGYHPNEPFRPPPEWDLLPGVFAITDPLPSTAPDEIGRAYWFYVRNQSAALDWDVLVRSLRSLSVVRR